MNMTLTRPDKDGLIWQSISDNGSVINLRRSYRRRFAALGVSAIGVLAIALFSSYLRNTSPSLSNGASGSLPKGAVASDVYPVGTGSPIPYQKLPGISDLKYSGATGVSPEWAPIANYSGQITKGGDIGLVDATSSRHSLVVQVSITNLTNLARSYSSFAFPLDIYEWCPTNVTVPGSGTPCGTKALNASGGTADTAGSWVPYETGSPYAVVSNQQLFLTNSIGSVTVRLPKGFYYDFAMDAHQGSFYCISTATPSDLSPSFYISAKADQ